MKHINIRILSFLLALLMLAGIALSSCTGNEPEQPDENDSEESSGSGDLADEYEETTKYPEILDFEGSNTVEYADYIKDGSNAYYSDADRTSVTVENMNMTLVHGLNGNVKNGGITNLVNSLQNKNGGVYIANTMDAFVKTAEGKTYYASEWMTGSTFNILRGGFYYNEVRIQDQGFGDTDAILSDAVDIDLSVFGSTSTNQVTNLKVSDSGILEYNIVSTAGDPGICSTESLQELNIFSKSHNALLITMKTELAFVAEVFVKTHKMNNYTQGGAKFVSLIPGDDFHTYIVRLDDLADYNGILDGIRIDIGNKNGEFVQIQSIKAINIDTNTVPVRFDRGLHTYSDKLHQ